MRTLLVTESLNRVANWQWLTDQLEHNGFPMKKLGTVAAVNDFTEKPKKKQINAHKAHLAKHLAEGLTPTVVMLIGNVALQSVTGKAGIKQKRGRPFEQNGNIYVPMMAPGVLLHDDRQRAMMEADVRLFCDIAEKGEIPREDGLDWVLVDNQRKFNEMLNALKGTVSFDLETTGLYQWDDGAKVVSIGFGTKDRQWCLPLNHPESTWPVEAHQGLMDAIDQRLQHCFLVAHNGKFDSLWLKVHYGLDWRADFDTMLAHWALDENARHGLKILAQVFYGAPNYDADLDTKTGAGPILQHCLYLAHDVYYTRKLRFTIGKLLAKDAGVQRAFEHITMPCASLFIDIEYHGVFVDVDRFEEAEVHLRQELESAKKELVALTKQYGTINWRSPQQLAKLFFEDLGLDILDKTGKGAPSTNESVLKRLEHPAAVALLRYRAADQLLKMFIDGWKPFLRDGRLHPNFKLHGTVTGRPSCERPNLQQVPRLSLIRSLIRAPNGWELVEIDLSQIEMRIAAELSGDATLLAVFDNNDDVHWMTAIREIARGHGKAEQVIETVFRHTKKIYKYGEAIEILLKMGPDRAAELFDEWKELRKKAKAINFGYLFGMWWKKFKIYARDNYGINVTDKEAQDSRKAFFALYPDLATWHLRQRRYARRNGYVRSLSGALRRLPAAMSQHDSPERGEAERQAINSPVQRFACELNLMTLIQLTNEFSAKAMRPVGTIHDAILIEVRKDWVETIVNRACEIMEHPQLLDELNIHLRVPIKGEAKVGAWSKGVSLEKWKKTCQKPTTSPKVKSERGAAVGKRTTTN